MILQISVIKKAILLLKKGCFAVSRASRRARVSARTSSALAEGSGQRRVPWGVNCAPRLALRLTSFINMAGVMAALARSFGAALIAGQFAWRISTKGLNGS